MPSKDYSYESALRPPRSAVSLYDIEKARARVRTRLRANEKYLAEHAQEPKHGAISNGCTECRFRMGWIEGLTEALILLGARKI